MSLFRLALLELLISTSFSFASIEYLEQRYFPEESFMRISEYFNGIEVAGNRIIIRSDAEHRTGHYVTFQLSSSYSIDHFKLEVYEHGSKEPTDYLFKPQSTIPVGKPVFLGLTGEKWMDKKRPPVAYRLSLIGKDGKTLNSATSFLWGDD
ncbi:MAG: hypothetical protein O7C75_07305 [Verrucomicrobia bacterium]|nr:hypothetical protein [Verrucomicrobiota bacterium]